jgi:hypothetical protein
MAPERIAVLACGVLEWNIRQLAAELPPDSLLIEALPAQLHQNPARLRELLQGRIDELSAQPGIKGIALGYGVCGRGTMDLAARQVPLVLPRTQDCIGISLGSHFRYAQEFAARPGTRYLTHGWYEKTVERSPREQYHTKRNQSLFGHSFEELADRYGGENADFICRFRDSWKRNYQRAAYIRFGDDPDPAPGEAATRSLADDLGWEHEVLEGDNSLLLAMLTGRWNDPRLLLVPPGHHTVAAPGEEVMSFTSGVESHLDQVLVRYRRPHEMPPPERHGTGLGIDTGGTYTDAVIYGFGDKTVLASAKAPTVHSDLLHGIRGALEQLPADLLRGVSRVGLSTTLATNAFVEHKGRPVGLLVMSPFAVNETDYPFRFVRHVAGALTMEGEEREPVCEDEIAAVARQAVAAGCEAIAISGFGSVVNPSHELKVAAIALAESGLHAVCGHELTSRLNFVERATTAAMNAKLVPLIESLIASVESALGEYGLGDAKIMMVKGDGSQMLAAAAKAKPVETVLSGPAASVVGAARLTGRQDAVVADMGGTTLDVAVLRHGLPAMREEGARIGDFSTSVAAMAVQTIGLGGDSEVDLANWPRVVIGPRRVVPLCRLAELAPDMPKRFVEEVPDSIARASGSVDVVALAPGVDPAGNRVLSQLAERPLLLGNLARRLNRAHPDHLNWRELESDGRLVRYGLTLTDILHHDGSFQRFDSAPVEQCLRLWALVLEASVEDLVGAIYHEFRRLVVDTVLRAALPESCPWAGPESLPLRQWLTGHFAGEDGRGPVSLRMDLGVPLVGVGAPTPTLFPQLGEVCGCEVLVSEYSGVANAVGAIAGDVMLRETAKIRMPDDGSFVCSWRGGSQRATRLDEALAICERALCGCLGEQAEANEIAYTEPAFSAAPSQAETREGSLLLGVTLVGELRG